MCYTSIILYTFQQIFYRLYQIYEREQLFTDIKCQILLSLLKNKKKVTMNDVFVAYEESPQTSLKDV